VLPRRTLRPALLCLLSFSSSSLALAPQAALASESRESHAAGSPGNGAGNGAGAPKNGGPAAPARIVEVRVGLSVPAAEGLLEPRVRRLLELELGERAVLAPGTSGPLGEHVAYVWIDLPSPSRVGIEVRVGDKPVTRRELGIAGLAWDVAARIVAITTSEMVRAQMRPARVVRRPPAPKGPSPEELEIASRKRDALVFTAAGLAGALVPQERAFLAGPSIGIALRRFGASGHLSAAWLAGPAEFGALRWLEVGLGVENRFWLSSSWRLAIGGAASMAFLHLSGVSSVDGVPGGADTWSARGGIKGGLEARLYGPLWLGLNLDPGILLRPVRYEVAPGAPEKIEGVFLGASLSLSVEWIAPAVAAGAR
jgi:hypothetical protein